MVVERDRRRTDDHDNFDCRPPLTGPAQLLTGLADAAVQPVVERSRSRGMCGACVVGVSAESFGCGSNGIGVQSDALPRLARATSPGPLEPRSAQNSSSPGWQPCAAGCGRHV
jgi:hypothetical protein